MCVRVEKDNLAGLERAQRGNQATGAAAVVLCRRCTALRHHMAAAVAGLPSGCLLPRRGAVPEAAGGEGEKGGGAEGEIVQRHDQAVLSPYRWISAAGAGGCR